MTPVSAAIWRRFRMSYISRSRLLDARLWLKRPLWQRIAERLFYFFSPLL